MFICSTTYLRLVFLTTIYSALNYNTRLYSIYIYTFMPIIQSTFKPAWGLSNPHIQTLWSTLFRKNHEIDLTEHILELDDGDFLELTMNKIGQKPIVIILHGLEGSIMSPYVKPLISALDRAGYGVCFIHFRGCGKEPNRLSRSYHSGETGDLKSIIKYLQNKHLRNPFAVIGFSLGGNVALKWMGEEGKNVPVSTAAAISVPFRLQDAGDRLEKSFSRVYQKHLLSSCQKKYTQKFAHKESPLGNGFDVKTLNTFFAFDDQITSRLHGFDGAKDYYAQCSSRQFLKNIRKPTLIIHAKDDPFMWEDTVPTEEELSSAVELELSDHGGHVGFIGGKHLFDVEYWIDKRVVQWLNTQRDDI